LDPHTSLLLVILISFIQKRSLKLLINFKVLLSLPRQNSSKNLSLRLFQPHILKALNNPQNILLVHFLLIPVTINRFKQCANQVLLSPVQNHFLINLHHLICYQTALIIFQLIPIQIVKYLIYIMRKQFTFLPPLSISSEQLITSVFPQLKKHSLLAELSR